jgi:hemolysin III
MMIAVHTSSDAVRLGAMTDTPTHYPTTRRAKCADLVVHLAGLACALLGGGILLGLAFGLGSLGQVAAVSRSIRSA